MSLNRKLFNAVAKGEWDKALRLIAKGGEATIEMLEAVVCADYPSVPGVKMLLDVGVTPTTETLYKAISHNKKETALLLLAAGAKADGRSLRHAATYFDAAWVQQLIDAGAKPVQQDLYAAITRSRLSKNMDVAKVLIKAGVTPSRETLDQAELWWGKKRADELAQLAGIQPEKPKISIPSL